MRGTPDRFAVRPPGSINRSTRALISISQNTAERLRRYQDLRFGFRLAVVIGIWLIPTPIPPRTFGGYFPRAFSAAAFVLNGFEILSG